MELGFWGVVVVCVGLYLFPRFALFTLTVVFFWFGHWILGVITLIIAVVWSIIRFWIYKASTEC